MSAIIHRPSHPVTRHVALLRAAAEPAVVSRPTAHAERVRASREAVRTSRAVFASRSAPMQVRASLEQAVPSTTPRMMMQAQVQGTASAPGANLRRGAQGEQVALLQTALQQLGYNVGPIDGDFGRMTEAALKAFQRDHGLTVDGYYGPQTRAALEGVLAGAPPAEAPAPAPDAPAPAAEAPAPEAPAPAPQAPAPEAPPATAAPAVPMGRLQRGSQGPEVAQLQTALQHLGYNVGPIDGDFGRVTEAALKAFQRDRGITVDGKYGPQSRGALEAALGGGAVAGPAGPAPAAGVPGETRAGIPGMLDWARSMVGTPYAAVNPFRFGDVPWDGRPHTSLNGTGTVYNYPAGTRVFDCSGFVVAAYRQLGVDLAARGLASSWAFDRDTSFLKPVSREQLAPGDMIIYQPKNGVGHVVIYLGDGKCIEAAGGSGVVIRDVDWARVKSYRRVPLPGDA